MTALLEAALRDVLADLNRDHQQVSAALSGQPAPSPTEPGLAALARELRRLRAVEPEAPAMALLAEAAGEHAGAVDSHLCWVASSSSRPALIVLPERTAAVGDLQLAS